MITVTGLRKLELAIQSEGENNSVSLTHTKAPEYSRLLTLTYLTYAEKRNPNEV